MSQPSISSYFPSRKRRAGLLEDGDALSKKRKVSIVENLDALKTPTKSSCVDDGSSNNLVQFLKKGLLSPHKLRSILTYSDPVESITKRRDEQCVSSKSGSGVETSQLVPNAVEISEPVRKLKDASFHESAKIINNGATSSTTDPHKGVELVAKPLTKNISDASRIRAKIKGHEKLPEFKDRLARLRKNLNADGKSRVEEKKELTPKLDRFKSVEIEVLSPTKRAQLNSVRTAIPPLVFSPTKTTNEQAYKNYQHLHQKESKSLPLPTAHRTLAEIFRAVDVICATLFNRNEKITFKRLKIAVQRMTKKNFGEKDLGRIKTVYPSALDFVVEKFRNFGSESKNETYQLIILPNYKTNESGEPDDKTKRTQLLSTRYKVFNKNLLDIVKAQHAEFLGRLTPPIVVDPNSIARWHPDFELNNCPAIVAADLPKKPQEATFTSAQEILSTAKNLFSTEDTRVEIPTNAPEVKDDRKKVTPTSSLLKGLPASLIEKIKQKQTAKALSHITKSSSTEPGEEWASSLPSIIRHIKNIYIAEKKSVMPFEAVISKIHNSYGSSFNTNKLELILKSLANKHPDIFSIQIVRKQTFFKLNRHEDFNKINNKLNTLSK